MRPAAGPSPPSHQLAHAIIGILVFAGEYGSAIRPRAAPPCGLQECAKRPVKPVSIRSLESAFWYPPVGPQKPAGSIADPPCKLQFSRNVPFRSQGIGPSGRPGLVVVVGPGRDEHRDAPAARARRQCPARRIPYPRRRCVAHSLFGMNGHDLKDDARVTIIPKLWSWTIRNHAPLCERVKRLAKHVLLRLARAGDRNFFYVRV